MGHGENVIFVERSINLVFRTPENPIFSRTYINRIMYFSRLFKNIRDRWGRFAGLSEDDKDDQDDDDDDNDDDDDDDNDDEYDNQDDDNVDNDDDDIEKEEAKAVQMSGWSWAGGRREARGGGSTPPPSGRKQGRRMRTTTATTKTARAVAEERTIATRTQEEELEEAEIIGQSFFLTPVPLSSSTSTNLKLDKHTACMW